MGFPRFVVTSRHGQWQGSWWSKTLGNRQLKPSDIGDTTFEMLDYTRIRKDVWPSGEFMYLMVEGEVI